MTSTTIADYQVLRDGSFTLQDSTNDVQTLTFSVPDDIHMSNSNARKAIIAFTILPLTDTRLTLRMHGTNIMTNRNFDRSHTRMHQETFSMNSVLSPLSSVPSSGAQVQFIAVGQVRISDVVLWYQIDR